MTKQTELPGVERPKVKEIEEAAEAYVTVRDRRMALTEKEVAAKLTLIEAVTNNRAKLSPNEDGHLCYRYDDMIVILKPGHATVKVKADRDGDDDDDD